MIRVLIAFFLTAQTLLALDFASLESLPVQEGGRKKPYLVLADESLLNMSGRTSLAANGRKQGALEVVTRLWLQPQDLAQQPLILVNNKPLKEACGLPDAQERFSYVDLASNDRLRDMLAKADDIRQRDPKAKLDATMKAAVDVGTRLALFQDLAGGHGIAVVPATPVWIPLPEGSPDLARLQAALASGDQAAFDQAVAGLRRIQSQAAPGTQADPFKIALEVRYQKVHPFRWAWILYLGGWLALLLTLTSRAGRIGYGVAWAFTLAGFAMQVAGFASRVLISGRAPVTNMYESVVWVAFGTILFALIFEAIHRCRYFLLGAIPVAVVSLILADSQPVILDHSIHPLTAVLSDNFWLTIHVLTITLSYAAFALGLGVGHIILGKVVLGSKPSPALYNYLYRTQQVGVLLLATGTILGGVWANYSWGRFWDFDPKETWALITLLCYLFILHGRIAGSWSGFGMAVGSVVAFQSVLMAWYGVNFVLGTGMHSYGFGVGGFGYAVGFVVAELLFVAFAVYRYRTKFATRAVKPRETARERVASA
jgi:ABC-type transport system involved in cytochrome c biogenesis permease subunit